MDFRNQATAIDLFSCRTPQMRAFHVTWFAFFLCFFGWFGIVPLMQGERGVIAALGLTPAQVGNSVIAAVALTLVARLFIGPLCTRFGARKVYTGLLLLGSLPVMGIGLAQTPAQFIVLRALIGGIGTAFVITQYHTSVMFAPNVVGAANATTAGWGNTGGGATQAVMPLILAAVSTFAPAGMGWRAAMLAPGLAMLLAAAAYWFLTQDAPDGNYGPLRAQGAMPPAADTRGTFMEAVKDPRVIALFFLYAAGFGMELTLNGTAALYFFTRYELNLAAAGSVASLFGLMNLFTRSLGGIFSDRINRRRGLKGRVRFLCACLCLAGLALIVFAHMSALTLAIPALLVFGLFVQMAGGATYAVVPYINKRALGAVAGIVGAGGNFGAVLAGFLFRREAELYFQSYRLLGILVVACAGLALAVRFSPREEQTAAEETASRPDQAGKSVSAGDSMH